MQGKRASWIFPGIAVLVVLGGIGYEVLRPRQPPVDPVTSRRPQHPDETARLENGFEIKHTREGALVFELQATRTLGIEDDFALQDVERLVIPLDDGRQVVVSAEAGAVHAGRLRHEYERLVLKNDVVVEDPDGIILETDELIYHIRDKSLESPGPARIRSANVRARVARMTYLPDSRILRLMDEVTVSFTHAGKRDEGAWNFDSNEATYRMASDEIVFAEPFRARQPQRQISAAGGIVRLPSPNDSGSFHARGPVTLSTRLRGGEHQLTSGSLVVENIRDETPERILAGQAVGILLRRVEGGVLQRAWIGGDRAVLSRSETVPGEIRLELPQGFVARITSPRTQEEWVVRGDRFTGSQRPFGLLSDARAQGHVIVEAPGGETLTGDELFWSEGASTEYLISGDPATARQGEQVIEAPSFLIDPDKAMLEALGSVLAEMRLGKKGAGGAFGGDDVVRVKSDRAWVPFDADRHVRFFGSVHVWQEKDTTSLTAAEEVLVSRLDLRLVAIKDVVFRFDREVEGGKRAGFLRADRLDYQQERRLDPLGPQRWIVLLMGHASYYESESMRVDSETMTIHLRDDHRIERLEADGDVRILNGKDRLSGTRLHWEGGREGWADLFGESALARLDSSEYGTVQMKHIRYRLLDGRIESDERLILQKEGTNAAPSESREGKPEDSDGGGQEEHRH